MHPFVVEFATIRTLLEQSPDDACLFLVPHIMEPGTEFSPSEWRGWVGYALEDYLKSVVKSLRQFGGVTWKEAEALIDEGLSLFSLAEDLEYEVDGQYMFNDFESEVIEHVTPIADYIDM